MRLPLHSRIESCQRRCSRTVAAVAVLLLLTITGTATERTFQFEGKVSYCSVDSLHYAAPASSSGLLYNTRLSAALPLNEEFALIINQRLRAAGIDTLFPEQLYPFENYAYGGIEYRGVGNLALGASNALYRNARSFPTPWYLPNSRISPDMLSAADATWDSEGDYFATSAAASYLRSDYTMSVADTEADSAITHSAPFGAQQDYDLWAKVSATFTFAEDFSLEAGGLTKQDLSTYRDYDLYRYRTGISGNHYFLRNRLQLEWTAAERFTTSPILKGSGYAVGFSTLLMSRIIWRIRSGFFVKACAQSEIAARLNKIYYEAQLIRTWDNGSNLNLSYFGTEGVLFPRQGMRISNKLVFSPHFALSEYIEGYLSSFDGGNTFRYYRSDYALELLFPIKTNLEFFAGGIYRHYNRHQLYAPRSYAYGGIRLW